MIFVRLGSFLFVVFPTGCVLLVEDGSWTSTRWGGGGGGLPGIMGGWGSYGGKAVGVSTGTRWGRYSSLSPSCMSTSPLSAMLNICAPPGPPSGGGFLDDGAATGSGDCPRIGLGYGIDIGGAGEGPRGGSLDD